MAETLREGWPTLKRKRRPRTQRVAARLSYNGRPFSGFQRQPGRRTVEGELIEALMAEGLTGGLGFASRTDSGVHAVGQVVAFKVPEGTALPPLSTALANRLGPDIRVMELVWAPAGFHPRWSATGKEYLYRVTPTDWSGVDAERLRGAVDALLRSPDLSGFTAAGGGEGVAPPLRSVAVEPAPEGAVLRFHGPAFRRYAIRHMVGALLAEARGEAPSGSCSAIAATRPPYRGPRAPADGLTLIRVEYPPALDPFPPQGT